jgi:hypothetical protein
VNEEALARVGPQSQIKKKKERKKKKVKCVLFVGSYYILKYNGTTVTNGTCCRKKLKSRVNKRLAC